MLRFEWDEDKDIKNQQKHGISFEEAKMVFYDDHAKYISDTEHSEDEERFIILGMSLNLNVLTVCHCYRESDDVIRIISARKATRNETKTYEEGLS